MLYNLYHSKSQIEIHFINKIIVKYDVIINQYFVTSKICSFNFTISLTNILDSPDTRRTLFIIKILTKHAFHEH